MRLLKIGITHGDINGISYEVLLRTLQDPELLEFCTPIVFGSLQVAEAVTQQLQLEPVPFCVIRSAAEAIDGRINLVDVCLQKEPTLSFGTQTEAALQAEADSLTAALEAYRQQQIGALVTLPGHLDNDDTTHALSNFISRAIGTTQEVFDWCINGSLRTLILHQMDVSTQLGEGLASEAFQTHIRNIHQSLRQDFGFIRPRMAIVSKQEKVKGDLDELRSLGATIFGPFDPATFVEKGYQHHYDACFFLGADDARRQAFEAEDPDNAIGYVSGLPLVLTYPLQGISYDIAGQGKANPAPFRQAIYAAIDIERSRFTYSRATAHPLEKQWIPRGRDDFKLDLTKEE